MISTKKKLVVKATVNFDGRPADHAVLEVDISLVGTDRAMGRKRHSKAEGIDKLWQGLSKKLRRTEVKREASQTEIQNFWRALYGEGRKG